MRASTTRETLPEVSIVIPSYLSEATIGGCLEALRHQTFHSFETIVVDSGPTDAVEEVLRRFPEVRYQRSKERLLPHAARNRGVTLARGNLLVFTDPDIYTDPDWLERLVRTQRKTGALVVSGLRCHGDRWLDQGIHLTKFSKWLAGAAPVQVDNAPTAGLVVPRSLYDELGGFPEDLLLGDAVFSWRARERTPLLLEPRAIARHHHLTRLGEFLRERYLRGRLFGDLRADHYRLSRRQSVLFLLASVLPLRLPRTLVLVALQCRRARQLNRFLATLPIILVGHGASLAGEASAYRRQLFPKQ